MNAKISKNCYFYSLTVVEIKSNSLDSHFKPTEIRSVLLREMIIMLFINKKIKTHV